MANLSFRFTTLASQDDLAFYLDELQFLCSFIPWKQASDYFKGSVPHTTLVHDSILDIPLGVFTLVLSKSGGAELHGVCRQDLFGFYGDAAKAVMPAFTEIILADVFMAKNCEKLIIKVPKESRGGRGFALRNGFRPINKERGSVVYKLTKAQYLTRKGVHTDG